MQHAAALSPPLASTAELRILQHRLNHTARTAALAAHTSQRRQLTCMWAARQRACVNRLHRWMRAAALAAQAAADGSSASGLRYCLFSCDMCHAARAG
jgi:hypothetical protein